MYFTKETAQAIEACFTQTHREITKGYAEGKVLEINGGAACFSGVDSFFSEVVGWGFHAKAKQVKADILAIEAFYKALNHPRVDIQLCPYVDPDLAPFLSSRGYRLSLLHQVYALDLATYLCESSLDTIREIKQEEIHDWAKKVALFFGHPEAQEQFSYYAQAKGTTVFGAFEEDRLIAGGAITVQGDVCDLGVTSTHPAYRGRGLHKKLLHARLHYAKQLDLRLATVSTEAGSISDLNVQKMGFQAAYTRLKMTYEIR